MEKELTGKIPRRQIGMLELPRLPGDLLAAFRALGDLSGLVSDACDELGIACGVPAAVLRPTDPKARIAGQALTVLNRRLDLPLADAVAAKVSRLGEIGYPVWSRGASPVTGKWRIETTAINVPVTICGITVSPGDLVVADEVGVCFVPSARAAEVLAVVKTLVRYEDERMAQINAGASVVDLANAKRPASK